MTDHVSYLRREVAPTRPERRRRATASAARNNYVRAPLYSGQGLCVKGLIHSDMEQGQNWSVFLKLHLQDSMKQH